MGSCSLACRKCQKKLKGDARLAALAKIKKLIKRRNKEHPDKALHVLNVACMDLCPKSGVTICNPAEVPNRLLIVRCEEDLETILR